MNALQRLREENILLMIHADDAGLSHSENQATIQALKQGVVNSFSLMVPCPWFHEMALFAKHNHQLDYGIHLTLTCEWENYRFGPVLPASEVPSLVDEHGHFYKKRELLREFGTPGDVKKELHAQIEKALKFGLSPTHLDSHMYSVGSHPEFFRVYKELGNHFNLPVLINRQLMEMVGLEPSLNLGPDELIIDNVYVGDYKYFQKGQLIEFYEQTIEQLQKGLNIVLIHPAFDTDEMKGITIRHPNFGSEWRQLDYDFFTGDQVKMLIKKKNIRLITWREIWSNAN